MKMKGSRAHRRHLVQRKTRVVQELLAVGGNGDGGGNLALIDDEGREGARGAALVHAAQRGAGSGIATSGDGMCMWRMVRAGDRGWASPLRTVRLSIFLKNIFFKWIHINLIKRLSFHEQNFPNKIWTCR
jgi:hypothetical protein